MSNDKSIDIMMITTPYQYWTLFTTIHFLHSIHSRTALINSNCMLEIPIPFSFSSLSLFTRSLSKSFPNLFRIYREVYKTSYPPDFLWTCLSKINAPPFIWKRSNPSAAGFHLPCFRIEYEYFFNNLCRYSASGPNF